MGLTFSDQIKMCQDLAGKDTSSTTKAFFRRQINKHDRFIVSKMPTHLSEITRSFSTTANQQYYHYPPEIREITSLVVTVGSINYPLDPIHSSKKWADLNALDIEPSVLPQYYFKRQRDFGIWPIPQDAYTATISHKIKGGGLVREDYNTGTVTVVANDAMVGGLGTTWTTNAKPGDWFVLTDSNGDPRGSWYRILSITDNDTLELESVFEEVGEAGVTYKIGQCSELPTEYQDLPAYGALADYFAGYRQSLSKAQGWRNMMWSGDWNVSKNTARQIPNWAGGIIGLMNDYKDRNTSQLIKRRRGHDPRLRVWGMSIN